MRRTCASTTSAAQAIQSAVRIASVIHAAAVTLEQQAPANAPVADLAA